MSRFPIGERLLPSLSPKARARLAILAETHAAPTYASHHDAGNDDALDSAETKPGHRKAGRLSHAALFDAAAAVGNAWVRQAPPGLSAQDVTSVAAAYLSEHADLLILTEEERVRRAERRSHTAAQLEAAALATARDGDYAGTVAALSELLALDPDRRLAGGRDVEGTRDALQVKAASTRHTLFADT